MKLFLDTANVDEIRELAWLIDGVTTNPSLIAREGRSFAQIIQEITEIVDGPISAEATALDCEGMVSQGRELAKIHDNVVIKIPMTEEGMKAVKRLAADGIRCNVTLVFSGNQALMAAKAGAAFVSPFVGRIDDTGGAGMDLIAEILEIYAQYVFSTEVIVASVRHPRHVLESALLGADIATVPTAVVKKLFKPPADRHGDRAVSRGLEEGPELAGRRPFRGMESSEHLVEQPIPIALLDAEELELLPGAMRQPMLRMGVRRHDQSRVAVERLLDRCGEFGGGELHWRDLVDDHDGPAADRLPDRRDADLVDRCRVDRVSADLRTDGSMDMGQDGIAAEGEVVEREADAVSADADLLGEHAADVRAELGHETLDQRRLADSRATGQSDASLDRHRVPFYPVNRGRQRRSFTDSRRGSPQAPRSGGLRPPKARLSGGLRRRSPLRAARSVPCRTGRGVADARVGAP